MIVLSVVLGKLSQWIMQQHHGVTTKSEPTKNTKESIKETLYDSS